MKNMNVYRLGLGKAIEEKLFFLRKINLEEYDLVVDFGCADGKLLRRVFKRIQEFGLDIKLLGYDNSLDMIRDAMSASNENINFTITKDRIVDEIKGAKKKTLIIFSSVLHELNQDEHKDAIEFMKLFDTVVIRDMKAPKSSSEPIDNITRKRIFKRVAKYMQDDFEKVWGRMVTKEQMYHFFLKYTYIENWETEVLENYFSTPWGEIAFELENDGYKLLYENSYTLDYKRKMVYKDFNHLMKDITHRQIIYTK